MPTVISDVPTEVAEKLRKVFDETGRSARSVARDIGMSDTTMHRKVSGRPDTAPAGNAKRYEFLLSELDAIATLLGATPHDLLPARFQCPNCAAADH